MIKLDVPNKAFTMKMYLGNDIHAECNGYDFLLFCRGSDGLKTDQIHLDDYMALSFLKFMRMCLDTQRELKPREEENKPKDFIKLDNLIKAFEGI